MRLFQAAAVPLCILLSAPDAAQAARVAQQPPRISGAPYTTLRVNEAFAFKPAASDANGDALTFSIANKPRWSAFNRKTGKLYGTPGPGDVGSYENIRISVSDGKATTSLPAFALDVVAVAGGSVTLSWLPPTSNEDGSPLVDLAGYWIYLGRSPAELARGIYVSGPGITRIVVEDLTPATWHFALSSVTAAGIEGTLSSTVSKLIP
jgi:hypothetical protein